MRDTLKCPLAGVVTFYGGYTNRGVEHVPLGWRHGSPWVVQALGTASNKGRDRGWYVGPSG